MNLDLTALAEIDRPAAGEPLMVPLDVIGCDPDQPRKRIDEVKLLELVESIRAIGVVQPISLRPDPATPGHYIINYGERRYRASLIAGLQAIPAFLHRAPDDYRQVAENLHHADLSPMEIALFIKKRLDAGERKNEIAVKLGYKKSYVTEHLALLESPACIEKAYASGVASARTLYDLRRLHDEFPAEVDEWCATGIEVTRESVAALAEKVRHDEQLVDVSASGASGALLPAAVVDTASQGRPLQQDNRSSAREDRETSRVGTGAFRRQEQSAASGKHGRGRTADKGAQPAGLPPASLAIRVRHDGRDATVRDDSLLRIRYEDGVIADVVLADVVVLGTFVA